MEKGIYLCKFYKMLRKSASGIFQNSLNARACRESESMIWDSNLVAIFLERPRDESWFEFFLNDLIQDWFANQRRFANLLLNKKLWIFDLRIINDSQIILDSRIIVDSNLDLNQILNWFATHESEIFDSRQAQLNAPELTGISKNQWEFVSFLCRKNPLFYTWNRNWPNYVSMNGSL